MAIMYARSTLTLWDASTVGGWSNTSGGASNGAVPTSTTDVIFDSNSGSARTIALSGTDATCKSLTTVGANAMTFSGNLYANGSVNLTGSVSIGNVQLDLSGTVTQGSCSLYQLMANSPGVVLTLGGAIVVSALLVQTGTTFTANNFNVTTAYFQAYGTATVNMGSGTWLINGGSTAFTVGSSCTVSASTSLLWLTGTSVTFDGGGKTYNNFWWDSISVCTLVGANTFNDVKMTGSSNNLVFPASTTTTLATLTADGTPYSIMSIRSSSGGTPATIAKSGGGTIMVYNCSITDITASPASTFYATRSNNSGGNTNWTFVVIYSGFLSFM